MANSILDFSKRSLDDFLYFSVIPRFKDISK